MKKTPSSKKGVFFKITLSIWMAGLFAGSILISAFADTLSAAKLRSSSAINNGELLREIKDELLKELLGDYKVSVSKDDLPNSYVRHIIDLRNSPEDTKSKLKNIFGISDEPGKNKEEYYLLDFLGAHIAVVKKEQSGKLDIRPVAEGLKDIALEQIVEDVEMARKDFPGKKDGEILIEIVLRDYLFLEERAKKAVTEQFTLTYKETRRHQEEFVKKNKEYKNKIDALKQKVSGDLSDGQVAGLMESIMGAYQLAAQAYINDDKKFFVYRELEIGGQRFKVRLTKKLNPVVTKIKTGDIADAYEWYIENITRADGGLNPSIKFLDNATRLIRELGVYRDVLREQILKVLVPERKIIAPKGKDVEAARLELAGLEKEYAAFLKISGLVLTGGKGLSLSQTDEIVDVPAGLNVTTTAYFKFIKDNPESYNTILKELAELDTMDDQMRDVVTRLIRETIRKGIYPKEMEREILIMYRHLNFLAALAKKKTPVAVAVRSSGIKEDIKVESWLPITTGSQAGQSDTYLNVKGEKAVLEKIRDDFASLFTDRAVSYRDDAIFLIFSAEMGFEDKTPRQVYNNLIDKLRQYSGRHPEFNGYADILTGLHNPGSVNLMRAMETILKYEPNKELQACLDKMKKTAREFAHPEEIGIAVVVIQMVKSEFAGVLFTVNPATKMAGVPQALYPAWYLNNDKLVYKDETGGISGTKSIVASFEISYGYGENVVGGKVNPDKVVMATYDGEHWFILEKNKGSKLIKMINVEEAIGLLKDKISEEDIREMASLTAQAVSYDEAGKLINGILVNKLAGPRYFKELNKSETDKDKKDRLQKISEEVASLIKDARPENEIKDIIKDNFAVVQGAGWGIQETKLDGIIAQLRSSVMQANDTSVKGRLQLIKYLNSRGEVDTFLKMLREVWSGEGDELPLRQKVLDRFNLEAKQFNDLSYLLRALIDGSFTCNLELSKEHQERFCVPDSEYPRLTDMAWRIAESKQEKVDIEFGIEIDPSVPEGKAIKMYVLDNQGRVMTMSPKGGLVKTDKKPEELSGEGKVKLKLYNLQARPYTARHIKVNFTRQRTEADTDFIEEHGIKRIASGTQGDNATHGYVLVFDHNKTIDWHARQINRLKEGKFTEEELKQIKQMGFTPDDYLKNIPIVLYLLEADPSHDPLMRLVNAVVTIRGGDTCHAAIFCREQGIPAITAVGKVMLDGHLLRTGDGLTVDSNNGNLYKLDLLKRIPINYVELMIKPFGIPGNKFNGKVADDDGFTFPTIGKILADGKAAQEETPIMLAPDAGGYALARAEFKGEQLGVNIFAGYGYDLIQEIKQGRMSRPKRVYLRDFTQSSDAQKKAFIAKIAGDIQQYIQKDAKIDPDFKRNFKEEDGIVLLTALDALRDVQAGALKRESLNQEDMAALAALSLLLEKAGHPDDAVNFLSYQYGLLQRRFNYDYNVIELLENNPWVMEEVEDKLKEKGYASFREFAGKEFYYFYNLMGFTIAPDQSSKNRAYDFAQDKVRGLIGSDLFSWPGINPLVGLRGTSLEIEGVSEESEGNQRLLSYILESVIDADKNTANQAWFYVFVRFGREIDMLDIVLDKIAKKKGKLPKQIGIMIEVPSDAILADKLSHKMKAIEKKYAQYGVKLVFFSFGTNDYAYLAGKADREDPGIKKLKLMDPAAGKAIAAIKQAGYFYNEVKQELPLVDEGAPVMQQLMEAVVSQANKEGIETSLCGEAITSLVARGNYDGAARMMSMLKSFGISQTKVRLLASMVRFDAMASIKQITVPQVEREEFFDLMKNSGQLTQPKGVVKGEVVYVESAEDLLAGSLRGLSGTALQERREFLEMQGLDSARGTMRTFNKIVVLTKNLIAMTEKEYLEYMSSLHFDLFAREGLIKAIDNNSIGARQYIWTNLGKTTADKFAEELKHRGYDQKDSDGILECWKKAFDNTAVGLKARYIDWNDLEYSLAIIVDDSVSLEGWDVFSPNKGIVPSRIKAKVKGIAGLRGQLEGQYVTMDYTAGKIYKGNLAVKREEFKPRSLPVPDHEPQVQTRPAVREDANSVYPGLRYHPLLLLAWDYEREKRDYKNIEHHPLERLASERPISGEYAIEDFAGNIFNEYVGKLTGEIEGIYREKREDKRAVLLKEFSEYLETEPENIVREFLQGLIENKEKNHSFSLAEGWLDDIRNKYLAGHKNEIGNLKKGMQDLLGDKSARDFIKEAFKKNMREKLAQNKDRFVVHTTTSLNCADFRNMLGGFLVEQVNPSRDYGLLGAARAVYDFYGVNRLELQAFKEVWEDLPVQERNNFGLQITELRGTQSGAVVIAWRYILEDMGIIPGKDGLEVGINIATPTDTLETDKYLEYMEKLGSGLSFVSYDQKMLGAAWSGVDIYWGEYRRLAQEEELREIGEIAAKIVKGKLESRNNSNRPAVRIADFDVKPSDMLYIDTAPPVVSAINRLTQPAKTSSSIYQELGVSEEALITFEKNSRTIFDALGGDIIREYLKKARGIISRDLSVPGIKAEIINNNGRPEVQVRLKLGGLETVGNENLQRQEGGIIKEPQEAVFIINTVIAPLLQGGEFDLKSPQGLRDAEKFILSKGSGQYKEVWGINSVVPVSESLLKMAEAQNTHYRKRALIIGPEFFRFAASVNTFREIMDSFDNLTVAVYGEDAKNKAGLLGGGEGVLYEGTFGEVIAELEKRGIAPEDRLVLNSLLDDADDLIKSYEEGNPAAKEILVRPGSAVPIIAAKAVRELYADFPEISKEFESSYRKMEEQEIIPEDVKKRSLMLAELNDISRPLMVSLEPDAAISKKIDEETNQAEEFLSKV